MKAKKDTANTAPQELAARPLESGAPAELAAIAEDVVRARGRRDTCLSVYESACKDALTKPAEKDGTDWSHVEEVAKRQLDDAELRLNGLRKMLLPYDKGIEPNRREGEKISVAEAREIFQQFMLSINLAIEQTIIADAQSAALCDSPEAFHIAHAENYRAAKDGAMAAAKNDGVLPAWIL